MTTTWDAFFSPPKAEPAKKKDDFDWESVREKAMTPSAGDEIARDRWGRPLIRDAQTGEIVAFTRVSTGAKVLDDQSGLVGWAATQAVRGLVARPDLYNLARTVGDDPAQIKDLANKAKEAAASDSAANVGTTLHWWTEQMDNVDVVAVPADAPDEYRGILHEYVTMTQGLKVLATELFVVCDELMFAGTLDRLIQLPDGRVVVGDLKTGKWASSYGALSVAVQCAIYAHGKRYDPATGFRSPLHPDIDLASALLIHLPVGASEQVQSGIYELDLEIGWRAAQMAREVMLLRKSKPASRYETPPF